METMTSIWISSMDLPHFDSLEGSIKTDVLIVGGGMAGILCAYFLKGQGVDCTLVEGGRICSKNTRNTTAKITAQHGLIYDKLIRSRGTEKAQMYLNANQDAVRKYAELCRNLDADWEEKTAYVYSADNRKKLEKEADALRKIGFDAKITEEADLPFRVAGAIGFPRQAQFHPLKFIAQIAEGLPVYENTFVKEWKDHMAVTGRGNIVYKKAIFATHFPIDNKHGMYFLKMYQERSYVLALLGAPKPDGMYIDEAEGGFSFRSFKEFLLLGGGTHRTGKCGGKWEKLREFAALHYPGANIKYTWAAQDCMTLDKAPYIGPYSRNMPDCYVASGFNKWGMSSSMAAAMILTDLVLERDNPYKDVFCPSRNMIKPQLFLNGWEAFTNLLTPSKKRCPHLGCALKRNSEEESWDCPCHGSRFDDRGKLLDNPANGDLGAGKHKPV